MLRKLPAGSAAKGGCMRFSTSVLIDRPVAEVFEFFTDLRNAPEWSVEVTEVRYDGDIRLGATGVDTRRSGKKTEEWPWTVTEYDPPHRVTFSYSTPVEATSVFSFEQSPDGTRMTCDTDLRPRGLWHLLAPFIRAEAKRNDRAQFAKAKALLEARGDG
jgi:uncharacterized protein YndB with AHSA1/START domain